MLNKEGKEMFFPINFHLSVVSKTKVAAVCVISTVNLAGKIHGMPVAVLMALEAAWSIGGLSFSMLLNCPRGICTPTSHSLARSIGYPKGDLPTALVVVRCETRAWSCAFSFPFLISLKTQLPCPAAS